MLKMEETEQAFRCQISISECNVHNVIKDYDIKSRKVDQYYINFIEIQIL